MKLRYNATLSGMLSCMENLNRDVDFLEITFVMNDLKSLKPMWGDEVNACPVEPPLHVTHTVRYDCSDNPLFSQIGEILHDEVENCIKSKIKGG